MKNDYHDYVIKNGKFIGRFEEMYSDCSDPWEQINDSETSYSKQCAVASIGRIKAKNVLEIGCGLGYYTSFLKKACPSVRFVGMDISETAIKKARNRFPDIDFICDNVRNIKEVISPNGNVPEYDAVIFSEIMWYILPDIKEIISILRKYMKNKYVLINQTFYDGGQEYGREFFTTQEGMIEYIGLECIKAVAEIPVKKNSSYATHTLLSIGGEEEK